MDRHRGDGGRKERVEDIYISVLYRTKFSLGSPRVRSCGIGGGFIVRIEVFKDSISDS